MTYNKEKTVKMEAENMLVNGVVSMLKKRAAPWTGTITQLNNIIVKSLNKDVREVWPRSPSALRIMLNRVINRIRNAGVSIRFTRSSDHERTRLVSMTMQ